MALKVHLKLCIGVPVECLIAELRNRMKDFRLIDSGGNSLMFHKTILQNISPKFDYLNKFCGEIGNGFEQMRLHTLGYHALQALYDLIYVGPVVVEEKRAWELCDQLQVLQLPLVTETRLESFLNYHGVQLNNGYSGEKNKQFQITSTPSSCLTQRMILPAEDVELLNRHGPNVDEIQETSRTLRWFDLNEIQRGTQIKRTAADGLSCIKQASVQSKMRRKQDIALHRMTVTSMTSSVKSDNLSKEVKNLTQKPEIAEKEKFLADFGLFYSPRPITRSLVKAIELNSDSTTPVENKALVPSKTKPKNSAPQAENLKVNPITKTNIFNNQAKQPVSRSSVNGPAKNTNHAKNNNQVSKSNNDTTCKNNNLRANSKTIKYSPKTKSKPNDNKRGLNSRGNKKTNGKKCNGIKYKSNQRSLDEDSSCDSKISSDEDTSGSFSSSSSGDEDESDDFDDDFDLKTKNRNRETVSKEKIRLSLARFKNQAQRLRYIEKKAHAMKQIIQAVTLALPDKQKFKRSIGFECFICGKLTTGSEWKDHILIKHYNMRFYCLKCGIDFKNVVVRNCHARDCAGI